MDYNVFLFLMLFNSIFEVDIQSIPYDDAHAQIERIYKNWRDTDNLYDCSSSIGTYESIEQYLKSNFDGIRHILSK